MSTSPRPSARGGIAARKIAQQERAEGSLYEQQALTDYGEIRARVQSEAVVCPYCEKETYVHPSNWLPHCELYHHSEPLAQYAAEIRAHIWEANDHMIAAGELLWQINTVLAHKGNGKFQTWVKAELEISLSKAYTLIKVSQQFKEHANIARTLAKTAVYALLDAPQSAYADVENLVNEGTPPDPTQTKAIVKAHKAAVELAQRYHIDDAQTIGALTDLAKTNMPLLLTIRDTGYVQPGNESEAVHITSDPRVVVKAINQIKRDQIQLHQKPDSINLSEFTRDELTQIQYHAEKLGALMDGCTSAYSLLVKLSDLNTGAKALLKS